MELSLIVSAKGKMKRESTHVLKAKFSQKYIGNEQGRASESRSSQFQLRIHEAISRMAGIFEPEVGR